jgi:hypothetical protein
LIHKTLFLVCPLNTRIRRELEDEKIDAVHDANPPVDLPPDARINAFQNPEFDAFLDGIRDCLAAAAGFGLYHSVTRLRASTVFRAQSDNQGVEHHELRSR